MSTKVGVAFRFERYAVVIHFEFDRKTSFRGAGDFGLCACVDGGHCALLIEHGAQQKIVYSG